MGSFASDEALVLSVELLPALLVAVKSPSSSPPPVLLEEVAVSAAALP